MSRGADANTTSWEEIEAAAKLQVTSRVILYTYWWLGIMSLSLHCARGIAAASDKQSDWICYTICVLQLLSFLAYRQPSNIIMSITLNNVVINLLQAKDQGFVDKCTDDDDLWIERLCVQHTLHMFQPRHSHLFPHLCTLLFAPMPCDVALLLNVIFDFCQFPFRFIAGTKNRKRLHDYKFWTRKTAVPIMRRIPKAHAVRSGLWLKMVRLK